MGLARHLGILFASLAVLVSAAPAASGETTHTYPVTLTISVDRAARQLNGTIITDAPSEFCDSSSIRILREMPGKDELVAGNSTRTRRNSSAASASTPKCCRITSQAVQWSVSRLAHAPSPRLRLTRVIDRAQVLHVAKLARLRLDEGEVERMAGELSGILEHVDRIGKLDLDGVEPTSHVVELENVLRPDEPRPSWPREVMLESAPDPADGAFRAPSPQAE
jgi:aspartyl-tRNA(Asn)/glutamyl-tRNA(Gln) amidotransferase subunit C